MLAIPGILFTFYESHSGSMRLWNLFRICLNRIVSETLIGGKKTVTIESNIRFGCTICWDCLMIFYSRVTNKSVAAEWNERLNCINTDEDKGLLRKLAIRPNSVGGQMSCTWVKCLITFAVSTKSITSTHSKEKEEKWKQK